MTAASATPKVTAGRIRPRQSPLVEVVGSHRSCTAKTKINSMPSQKLGMEIPLTAVAVTTVSTQV